MRLNLPTLSIGLQSFDSALEQWRKAIESAINTRYQAPLHQAGGSDARVILFKGRKRIVAQLTANSGGGAYTFTQVDGVASPAGTWNTLAGGFTGTCYEFNSTAAVVVPSYVELELDPSSNQWRFAQIAGAMFRTTSGAGIGAGGSLGGVLVNGVSTTVYNPYTKAVPASVVMWVTWNSQTNHWEVVDWDC